MRHPPPCDAEEIDLAAALPQTTIDGRARATALKAIQHIGLQPTSFVEYRAEGWLLVVGAEERALAAAARLEERLAACAVILPLAAVDSSSCTPQNTEHFFKNVTVSRQNLKALSGHLGHFIAIVSTAQGDVNLAKALRNSREDFDLVLDLTTPPLIRCELPPPGYYAPGDDVEALEKALAEIPQLVGEFEKPKYFHYNPVICAHGNSGLKGCTQCLDACPTDAIRSAGDLIEVDPHLCQGQGSCASVCPTGAITYAFPKPSDLLLVIKGLLTAYRDGGGQQACLLFHDTELGKQAGDRHIPAAPERVIPVEVEEIGSVGMDVWLAALVYGASYVILLATHATPPSVLKTIKTQLRCASAILDALGYDAQRLRLFQPTDSIQESLNELLVQPDLSLASFIAPDEKRNTLRFAIDHLYKYAPRQVELAELPEGAPFGEIKVNRETCTLCMSCVSVCPASALIDGKDTPRLGFIEWNCVQCGLCEIACPEDAITRFPRIVFDQDARMKPAVLNEEEPFRCIVCGKAFATKSMLNRMQEKLKDHWMFQDQKARRRLEMCEQCRVKDLYTTEGLIDVRNKR